MREWKSTSASVATSEARSEAVPGKRTLTDGLSAPVQRQSLPVRDHDEGCGVDLVRRDEEIAKLRAKL